MFVIPNNTFFCLIKHSLILIKQSLCQHSLSISLFTDFQRIVSKMIISAAYKNTHDLWMQE